MMKRHVPIFGEYPRKQVGPNLVIPPGYVWPRIKQRIRLRNVIAEGRPDVSEPACLDLSSGFSVTTDRLRSLCLLFSGNEWIEELDMNLSSMSMEWDFVMQMLAVFPNLKSFRYASSGLLLDRIYDRHEPPKLIEYVRETSVLQRLEWEPRGGMPHYMETDLLSAIGQNRSITHLKFTSEYLSASGLPHPPHMTEMLLANRTLKYVELGKNISSRVAILLLQECLADHPSIVSVALQLRMQYGEDVVNRALVNAVLGSRRLRWVSFRNDARAGEVNQELLQFVKTKIEIRNERSARTTRIVRMMLYDHLMEGVSFFAALPLEILHDIVRHVMRGVLPHLDFVLEVDNPVY